MRTETSLRAALRDTLARLHPTLHDIQWVPEDCSHQSRPRARGHLLGHVSSRPPDFEGTRTLSHGPERLKRPVDIPASLSRSKG